MTDRTLYDDTAPDDGPHEAFRISAALHWNASAFISLSSGVLFRSSFVRFAAVCHQCTVSTAHPSLSVPSVALESRSVPRGFLVYFCSPA